MLSPWHAPEGGCSVALSTRLWPSWNAYSCECTELAKQRWAKPAMNEWMLPVHPSVTLSSHVDYGSVSVSATTTPLKPSPLPSVGPHATLKLKIKKKPESHLAKEQAECSPSCFHDIHFFASSRLLAHDNRLLGTRQALEASYDANG